MPHPFYHLDDIAGRYNPEVEVHYRKLLEDHPQNPWAYWCLIQFFLTQARMRAADEIIQAALKIDFPVNEGTYQTLHWRIAYMLIETGERIQEAAPLLAAVDESFRQHPRHLAFGNILDI